MKIRIRRRLDSLAVTVRRKEKEVANGTHGRQQGRDWEMGMPNKRKDGTQLAGRTCLSCQ